MPKIEITVQPGGQTKVESKGFAGPECRQASEFLEKALGRRTGEQLTAEFYQAADTEATRQRQA